ncbi:TPM domain-containing protein [Roseateles oligotrophus]|uniref:TPM domain-containing protein n=1 Tax=Roseateles oligotrophus TaxID=1769250 RepID=A0ABT2YDF9_9BURK|nr:TPM domain-containing protein [Roseateles oligotrophus]MCV2368091.1 TPM domain-containing protein [Roseateles oligotrophus]
MPQHQKPLLSRIFKHRWTDQTDLARALPATSIAGLEASIRASESRHSGQICVCVEAGLPMSYLSKRLSARQRAVTLFGKLRTWDTEANNGVLIYLLLADHAIEIVADRGLNARVSEAQWAGIVEALRSHLSKGQFEQGLKAAIDAVDALLRAEFPLAAGQKNPNELPDAVVIL